MRLAPIDPLFERTGTHIRNSPLFTLPPMFATTGATNKGPVPPKFYYCRELKKVCSTRVPVWECCMGR